MLVLHDITDLRRADQIRRDFVANVSHELRTPLTAIRGYVEALLDDRPDAEDTTSSWRSSRATAPGWNGWSATCSGSHGSTRARKRSTSPVRPAAAVQHVLGDVAQTAEAKRQRITTAVDPAACRITADPAKLHDVLRNLVENAVHYAPEAATINLEATHANGDVPHFCVGFGSGDSA